MTTTQHTITIPERVVEAIRTSSADGMPLMISYRAGDGVDHPSFRGSTHVHGPSQLALWVRKPEGAMPRAVGEDGARLDVMYRNPIDNVFYRLSGLGRLVTDDATRQAVYSASPPVEQMQDFGQKGTALLIDIDRIAGYEGETPVLIEG